MTSSAERAAHHAPATLRFDHVVFAAERAGVDAALLCTPRAPARDQPKTDDREALDPASVQFFSWLCRERGLDVTRYRPSVLRRRTAACLRSARAASIVQLRSAIAQSPEKLDRALGALLIGVTSFFRDAGVFHALEAELPRLASAGGRLNVLSVACSDGAELYSVAMLLEEHGLLARSRLHGVDCRADAIATARAGAITPEAAAHLTPERVQRHFRRAAGWRLNDALRAACTWEVADAFTLTSPEPVDLLLCRNLAIYLNPAAASELWARLGSLLRPRGLLVTGKAERPGGPCAWRRVGPCMFQKVETE